MIIVFSVLILLTLVMLALGRIFKPRSEEE
jgi:Na+-transporting methylmalonyl-CoA/oxaloacetate decarboxylase gamma subunit